MFGGGRPTPRGGSGQGPAGKRSDFRAQWAPFH